MCLAQFPSLCFLNLSLLFYCLGCSMLGFVPFVAVPSPIFLLLQWYESSSWTALDVLFQQNLQPKMLKVIGLKSRALSLFTTCSLQYFVCTWTRCVQCFGFKEVSTCIYEPCTTDIYILYNPPFNSLVWGSLRLAPNIMCVFRNAINASVIQFLSSQNGRESKTKH